MRFLLSVGLLFAVASVGAATFVVTNTNDNGPGSLRDAIAQANAASGTNTIDLSVTGTIVLTSGQIQISGPLTIIGPGADSLTIDANANGRVFSIFVTDPACPALDGPGYLVSISGVRPWWRTQPRRVSAELSRSTSDVLECRPRRQSST